MALAYAVMLGVWFARSGHWAASVFTLLFACAVTISVQLVGLYLVFTTLIVPALATRRFARHRLAAGYALSAAGYALGLVASTVYGLAVRPGHRLGDGRAGDCRVRALRACASARRAEKRESARVRRGVVR